MSAKLKVFLILVLILSTSGAVAEVVIDREVFISGVVNLSDSNDHSGIDVKMYVYHNPNPPIPIPATSGYGVIFLLLTATFFIIRRKKFGLLPIILILMAGTIVLASHSYQSKWHFVTRSNGRYRFSSSYGHSVSYYISFMKDGYYSEYYGLKKT